MEEIYMCFRTTDGRRIDNVVSDYMPRYPKGQKPPSPRDRLKHPKPLEVFTAKGPTFGHLIGQKSDGQFRFTPAGENESIIISGDLPAIRSTKERIISAAEMVAA